MATFADHLDLRVAVAENVGRDDLSDLMPRFIQQAETKLNEIVRHSQQITDTTLTFASGSAALPADFLEMIHVYDANGCPMRAGSLSDANINGSQYYTYAIHGSTIRIYGLTGDRDIVYYAKLATLTTLVSTSNWLLASYPDVYEYAVTFEAAKWVKDAEMALTYRELLKDALNDMKIDNDHRRWSNAIVRVQGSTP